MDTFHFILSLISMLSVFPHTSQSPSKVIFERNKHSVGLGFFDKRKWMRILCSIFLLMWIIWGDWIHHINQKCQVFGIKNEIVIVHRHYWISAIITIILMDHEPLLFKLIHVITEDETTSLNQNLVELKHNLNNYYFRVVHLNWKIDQRSSLSFISLHRHCKRIELSFHLNWMNRMNWYLTWANV